MHSLPGRDRSGKPTTRTLSGEDLQRIARPEPNNRLDEMNSLCEGTRQIITLKNVYGEELMDTLAEMQDRKSNNSHLSK